MNRAWLVLIVTFLATVLNEPVATTMWAKPCLFAGMLIVMAVRWRRPVNHTRGMIVLFALPIAWMALCFLPAGILTAPDWLSRLSAELDLDSSEFVTPQPWTSLHQLLTVCAVTAWVYFLTGTHWRTAERKWCLIGFVGTTTIIALVFLFLSTTSTPWPWAQYDGQFGPFANRNQTGALFALAGTLAGGLLLVDGRTRWRRSCVWIFCLTALTVATAQVGSRAGVIALAAGVLATSACLSLGRREWRPLALGGSILLLSIAYLLLDGGRLTQRLEESLAGHHREGRIAIWEDASNLTLQSPLLGTGFGNFEPAFAQTREASISEYRVRHPESDWLWLASEAGIPAALLVGILVVALVKRIAWRRNRDMRERHHALQLAAGIAVLLFLAVSVIDVPAHRIGTILPAVLLLGMATGHQTVDRANTPLPPPLWFKGGSLATLTAGIACWLLLPSPVQFEHIIAEVRSGTHAENERRLEDASIIKPLDWRVHFLQATIALHDRTDLRTAQRSFRRARALAPNAPLLPRQEADLWIKAGLVRYAVPAWRELLRNDPTRAHEHFDGILRKTNHDPILQEQLFLLAQGKPDLELRVLLHASDSDSFKGRLDCLLDNNPTLRDWDEAALSKLNELWFQKGDLDALEGRLAGNPNWSEVAWKTLFRLKGRSGDHTGAVELATARLVPEITVALAPLTTAVTDAELSRLRSSVLLRRADLATGLQLARAEASLNHPDRALAVVQELERMNNAQHLPPVQLLKAWCLQQLDRDKEAYSAFATYLDNHP